MADDAPSTTVVIDREVCMGLASCVVYAPHTFTQDEEAKAIILDPRGDSPDSILAAVEACPTGALSVIDEEQH